MIAGFEMKVKEEKDKRKLYAQLLVDFANSKTTDEAGLGYLRNLQKVYNFPQEFVEKVYAGFPRMLDPSDPKNEKPENIKIAELMSRENELHSIIEGYLWDGLHLLRYEYQNGGKLILDKKIILISHQQQHLGKTVVVNSHPMYSISNLTRTDFTRNIRQQYWVEINKRWEVNERTVKNEIIPIIEEWVKIIEKLSKAKMQYNSDNFSGLFAEQDILESKSRWYVYIGLHSHIRVNIKIIKSLLQAIVDNNIDTARDIIEGFVSIYNFTKSRTYISNDLRIKISKDFDKYFSPKVDDNRYYMLYNERFYDQPIADCVVELLKSPVMNESVISKLIKKCKHCNKFYLVNKNISNQKFCTRKCQIDYNNGLPKNKKKVTKKVRDERAKGRYL